MYMYVCIYICMYIYVYIYMCIYIYMCVCVCVCVCVCIYTPLGNVDNPRYPREMIYFYVLDIHGYTLR